MVNCYVSSDSFCKRLSWVSFVGFFQKRVVKCEFSPQNYVYSAMNGSFGRKLKDTVNWTHEKSQSKEDSSGVRA